MKPTLLNQVEFARRVAERLKYAKGKAGPLRKAKAYFEVRYPRLTKEIPIKITAKGLPSYAAGGAGPRLPQNEKLGFWAAMREKSRPHVMLNPSAGKTGAKTLPGAMFVLGHEMRHAVDMRKKSLGRVLSRMLAQKIFVPYGLRPTEWRANKAGIKAAAPFESEQINKIRGKAVHIAYGVMGAGGAGVRTAVGGGVVAGVYKFKRARERRRLAAAATVGSENAARRQAGGAGVRA
jgi:hypothetical protein